ncbi:MAG: integration host factor subunit alpha [Desulfobulbaceae bacterium]|nr:MAG: integration host factor subunit alpha [Desulfobulbaceae bacterium]
MALTKADLIQRVYQQHALSRYQAIKVVESFLAIIKRSLQEGEDLLLSGFGKFKVKQKQARRGRNPQTGDELILPPRKVITFKPARSLRDRINCDH